jgi:enterochelin esterase-like enzyme
MLLACALYLLGLATPSAAAPPATGARIVEMPSIRSAYLPPQQARVWLPPGYDGSNRRYKVLYVNDGQWAFRTRADDDQAFAIDESIQRLVKARKIEPVIVVAVFNPGNDRFRQYLPQPMYNGTTGALRAAMDKELSGKPVTSAAFLAFLANELKPAIDAAYRTRAGAKNSAIIGASMGGLITAAAFIEHPDLFGRAACISPQWPLYDVRMVDYPALLTAWPAYFARLGAPEGRKLWLDHGTTMIDAGFGPYQTAIARQLEANGWRRGRNLEARVHQGGAHIWSDWAAHMDELLTWLLN